MADQKVYRLVEKRGKVMLADLNNNPLQPHEALRIAQTVSESAQAKSFVYIGQRESDGLYKIGYTNDLDRRRSELGIMFLQVIECDLYGDYAASIVEARLHEFFAGCRIEGEWFKLEFADLELLRNNCNSARETLPFINDFGRALNRLDKHTQEIGFYRLIADFINNSIPEKIDRQAVWYTVNLRAAQYSSSGQEIDAVQYETIVFLLAEIFNSRGVDIHK